MSVVYLGSVSTSELIPIAVAAQVHIGALVGIAEPMIVADLAAAASLQVTLTVSPPSLTATIDAAVEALARLEASVGIEGPTITLTAELVAVIIAELKIQLGLIRAAAAFQIPFAGVHAYTYAGRVGDLGAAFAGELATGVPDAVGPGAQCNALLLVTTTQAAWATLSVCLKTS